MVVDWYNADMHSIIQRLGPQVHACTPGANKEENAAVQQQHPKLMAIVIHLLDTFDYLGDQSAADPGNQPLGFLES
jgi:hypothetical protein